MSKPTHFTREELKEKVQQFYEEKKIDMKKQIEWHTVPARMILFVEWLQEQNKEETWQDIFNAQP